MNGEQLVDAEENAAVREAQTIFEREVGATGFEVEVAQAGTQRFLKFVVGREAPIYNHALRITQKELPETNLFRGLLGLKAAQHERFPSSQEASCLLTLLTRATRPVAQGTELKAFSVPYVPFQNREDYKAAQPASQLIVGRRGVGKSTLIRRAVELVKDKPVVVAVLDMQAYTELAGDFLAREVLHDLATELANSADEIGLRFDQKLPTADLRDLAAKTLNEEIAVERTSPALRRILSAIRQATGESIFVFLDDYHLVAPESQPDLLHIIHGALKGANGWLKVAGLRSLLNHYSSRTRKGLQEPGDAQRISLDLTLENPEAAESHLRAILENFLAAVGYPSTASVLSAEAFRRLVWASAGVPRDFLQMFERSVHHARRNRHSLVTLTDINITIGEFGQRKIEELQQDARNSEGFLRAMLQALEKRCLDNENENERVNAFLVRSEASREREAVHTLSDLRLVHLIHQSTTPRKAGERYEAFILDYSLFTGFRRRPRIKEMVPEEGQFKASELRKLPKISSGFAEELEGTSSYMEMVDPLPGSRSSKLLGGFPSHGHDPSVAV